MPNSRGSKFRLGKHWHDGVPFWSPLDLLGLFLSTGPAPVGATKRNFFLPMTAMFGRCCQQLIDDSPYMFNCTWEENGPATFFLGASLAGGSFNPELVGSWKSVVGRARYELMGREVLSLAGWSFSRHPQLILNQRRTPIGNCAECYAFFYLLR